MAAVTFSETLDWLAEHEGQRVVVEVGSRDLCNKNADLAVLRVHTTLGVVFMVDDREHGTGVARIPFLAADTTEVGGIEIAHAHFQEAKTHLGLLKVWQNDVYVVVSPTKI